MISGDLFFGADHNNSVLFLQSGGHSVTDHLQRDHLLKNFFLFKSLTDSELKQLSPFCIEKDFSPGQDVFIHGQKASAFYLIRIGSVKIFTTSSSGDDLGIATLGSGSHFGEIPFLDQGERTANAQTLEPSKILEISYEKLQKFLDGNPNIGVKVYFSFAKFLAARLRHTLDDLSQARQIKLKHF